MRGGEARLPFGKLKVFRCVIVDLQGLWRGAVEIGVAQFHGGGLQRRRDTRPDSLPAQPNTAPAG
jgi:hypothetical protein